LCFIIIIIPILANADNRDDEGEGKKGDACLVELDTFIVNVHDEKVTRFAKLGVYIQLSTPALAEMARTKNAAIRDAVITLVSSKTAQDILSPEGKQRLEKELVRSINCVLGDKAVKSIYFTEITVQ
jgi:flagellar FliL protein